MILEITVASSRPDYLPRALAALHGIDAAPFYLCIYDKGFTWNLSSLNNLDRTIESCLLELQKNFEIFTRNIND